MNQETSMDLPVRFPGETAVILDDVARFRARSPADRIRTIQGMLADGEFLISKSANAAWARQYALEQELLAQRNIREFIARHGPWKCDGQTGILSTTDSRSDSCK
jgi:hypothetical protein